MKTNVNRYTNASFLLGGAACTLLLVNHILFCIAPYEDPLVPGFRFLTGLATPLLCFCAGALLRMKRPSVRWWITGLVAAVVAFCLCMYVSPRRVCPGWWSFLNVAVIGAGFLCPPRSVARARRDPGWAYLVLFAVSAFCYTAVFVSMDRVRILGALSPVNEDMIRLVLRLLTVTEPLLILIAVYFAWMFSVSRAGQRLGRQAWFRWIVAVPCLCGFFIAAYNLFFGAFFSWDIILVRLIQLLVQPVTVYLLVILPRSVKKLRGEGEWAEKQWKDILRLS